MNADYYFSHPILFCSTPVLTSSEAIFITDILKAFAHVYDQFLS